MDDLHSPNVNKLPHLRKEQRLPRCYKDTEKFIISAKSCKINFKTALANSRLHGKNFKKVYNLTFNVLKHYDYIQKIIQEVQLLEKETFLRRELASVLVYEILYGRGNLPGESKPICIIQKYQNNIMNIHQKLQSSTNYISVQDMVIPRYARVHTLVTTVPYVIKDLEDLGFKQIIYNEETTENEYINLLMNIERGNFIVDFHFKDILGFAHNENLCSLQLYVDGHIFLQDKSSYIPVHVLNPEQGSTVLDACAAPGMKSVHIASRMKNKGVLFACERDNDRFKTLQEMLQYGAVKISKMLCTDFRLIDPYDPVYSSVNYILLDPTCSGSGMVNRMDQVTDTEDSKSKDRLEKLAGFQIVLLKHALKFPSVKRVVYSTCSIHEEENEYVVHEVLNAFNRSFKLVPAMPEWTGRGVFDMERYAFGELCLRTVTQKHLTNGFFVAVFERIDHKNNEMFHKRNKKFKNNAFHSQTKRCNNEDTCNFSSEKVKMENTGTSEMKKVWNRDKCFSASQKWRKKNLINSLEDGQDNLQNTEICEESSNRDFREKQCSQKAFGKIENFDSSENYLKHKKKKKDKKTKYEYNTMELNDYVNAVSEENEKDEIKCEYEVSQDFVNAATEKKKKDKKNNVNMIK